MFFIPDRVLFYLTTIVFYILCEIIKCVVQVCLALVAFTVTIHLAHKNSLILHVTIWGVFQTPRYRGVLHYI